MELLLAPPPTPPTRLADSNPTTCPPPNHHHHHLQLPLLRHPKHNLSLFPHHPPSPSLTPQPNIPWRHNNNNNNNNNHNMKKKKKRKRKGATTSHILHLMDALPFPIPIDIYTSLIKECTLSQDSETAIELHTHIARSGIKPPLSFINRILIMFVSCGLFDYACQLFDAMTVRDFNSWATLFLAYYDNADYEEAIDVFVNMLRQLVKSEFQFPPWIWACLLKACACTENIPLGLQVHGWLLKLGACNNNVLLSSSLIRFYGRFKCLEDANAVFDKASRHNTSTWTAKIVSSCTEMDFPEVVSDFKEMGRQGVKKDTFTFSSVLKACGKMMDYGRCGEQVHADAVKLGLASDNYVQCSLIAMYGRSGLLRDAEHVFETSQSERNIDSWNAMLMGYLENGLNIEAVKFLYQMKAAGLKPHESLVDKVRVACGSVNYSSMN